MKTIELAKPLYLLQLVVPTEELLKLGEIVESLQLLDLIAPQFQYLQVDHAV